MASSIAAEFARPAPPEDNERLLAALLELSSAHDVEQVRAIVHRVARDLVHADGVTFVLREGARVHYVDENAIAPLWKGRRFPIESCISGWAMLHRRSVAIEDIYTDERIPLDLYRPTFVRSLAMVPVRLEDPLGAIGAYWGVKHRATERELKLLEALAGATAVALANARLWSEVRRAAEARDDFLAIASHELRTPLTPLLLRIQSLRRALERGADSETTGRGLERVEHQVQRLVAQLDSLLEISRLARGALSLHRQPMDLRDAVAAALAELQPELQRSGSELTVVAPHPVLGRWDAHRMEQVARHLLSNALKFGAGRPVDVEVGQEGAHARLVVRDRGPGIAVEDQRRIFERFERAVSPQHFGGFGLGLWMVRQLVEAHGGEIGLQSGADGSVFTVVLPAPEAAL